MFLASAYPDSAISPLAMVVIAFVVAVCLAIWLGMVFAADRQPRHPDRKQSRGYPAAMATPGKATEDGEHQQQGVTA